MALFFSAATAAGAFGGLLAFGIGKLDHKDGLNAWSWIFIIEGAITLAIGKSTAFPAPLSENFFQHPRGD